MAVVTGRYFLRASPVPASGTSSTAMFATSPDEEKAPVITHAQAPDSIERQHWLVWAITQDPEEAEADQRYRIVTWNARDDHGGALTTGDPAGVPQGPVIINSDLEQATEWLVEPVEIGVPRTYTIRPVTKAAGMKWYIGTEGTNVVIKAFAVGDDAEKPYWQFVEAP